MGELEAIDPWLAETLAEAAERARARRQAEAEQRAVRLAQIQARRAARERKLAADRLHLERLLPPGDR